MGREYEYTWKIVQHDPPKRMAVESTSGPFPTTLDFEFTGRDGETDVTATVTSWPTGLMRLFQPVNVSSFVLQGRQDVEAGGATCWDDCREHASCDRHDREEQQGENRQAEGEPLV
jgi:hypothetical protein